MANVKVQTIFNEAAKLFEHGSIVEIDGKRFSRRAIEQLTPIKLERTIQIGALHYSVAAIATRVKAIPTYRVGNVIEFVSSEEDHVPEDVFTALIARTGDKQVGLVILRDGNLWDTRNCADLPSFDDPLDTTDLLNDLTVLKVYASVDEWRKDRKQFDKQ